jgi:hypothetical protein
MQVSFATELLYSVRCGDKRNIHYNTGMAKVKTVSATNGINVYENYVAKTLYFETGAITVSGSILHCH